MHLTFQLVWLVSCLSALSTKLIVEMIGIMRIGERIAFNRAIKEFHPNHIIMEDSQFLIIRDIDSVDRFWGETSVKTNDIAQLEILVMAKDEPSHFFDISLDFFNLIEWIIVFVLTVVATAEDDVDESQDAELLDDRRDDLFNVAFLNGNLCNGVVK